MENIDDVKRRLLGITAVAAEYCITLENVREMEKTEFISRMLDTLPRIYWEFLDFTADNAVMDILSPEEESEYYTQQYVDEEYYESIRRNVGMLLGEEDTYLDTFEEDMKYSDTPIAASVSESLADIFQPLYNFISAVKDSDGHNLQEAYTACREEFDAYWSQTLCNVLRPLNAMRLH